MKTWPPGLSPGEATKLGESGHALVVELKQMKPPLVLVMPANAGTQSLPLA